MKKKICTKCGDKKLISEFSKDKNKKDGLCLWYKKCKSKYYEINKEKILEQNKKWCKSNPEKIRKIDKKWRKNNPEYIKKWRENNIEYAKKWRENNPEYNREYQKERLKNDPIFRLNHNMRVVIRKSLKGNKNGNHWELIVGYTLKDLKNHLESQFQDGMTWNNYGKWHIDHRIPISLFNIKNVKSKGFKKAWTLDNLQPLWAKENLSKYNKLFN